MQNKEEKIKSLAKQIVELSVEQGLTHNEFARMLDLAKSYSAYGKMSLPAFDEIKIAVW